MARAIENRQIAQNYYLPREQTATLSTLQKNAGMETPIRTSLLLDSFNAAHPLSFSLRADSPLNLILSLPRMDTLPDRDIATIRASADRIVEHLYPLSRSMDEE